MVRVCTDWFPNKKNPDKAGFYMEEILKANLDLYLKNASKKDDWDFVGIISGSGRVRVGKSVLALQIAIYWIHQLEKLYNVKIPFKIKENIVFHGEKLISQGNLLSKKYSQNVLLFDEAGADLESTKVLRASTQAVKDFLRECGQYNFLTILVIPEFFDLPKGIALSRSDFLIDVYPYPNARGKLERGFFNFYSRPNKKMLYLMGKKELNYKAYKYDFHGRFYNFYPIDEKEYRVAKQEALKTREINTKSKDKHIRQRSLMFKLCNELGKTPKEISEYLKKHGEIITRRGVSRVLEMEEERRQITNKSFKNEEDLDDDDKQNNNH